MAATGREPQHSAIHIDDECRRRRDGAELAKAMGWAALESEFSRALHPPPHRIGDELGALEDGNGPSR